MATPYPQYIPSHPTRSYMLLQLGFSRMLFVVWRILVVVGTHCNSLLAKLCRLHPVVVLVQSADCGLPWPSFHSRLHSLMANSANYLGRILSWLLHPLNPEWAMQNCLGPARSIVARKKSCSQHFIRDTHLEQSTFVARFSKQVFVLRLETTSLIDHFVSELPFHFQLLSKRK